MDRTRKNDLSLSPGEGVTPSTKGLALYISIWVGGGGKKIEVGSGFGQYQTGSATLPVHVPLFHPKERMLELLTNLPCRLLEQIFRPLTTVKGKTTVELQPKGLWFKAQLTWIIFIFCYNIPYYSLLLCLIWRNVAQMVNTSLFCPLEQKKSGHFAWS